MNLDAFFYNFENVCMRINGDEIFIVGKVGKYDFFAQKKINKYPRNEICSNFQSNMYKIRKKINF